jgi:aspartate kinase
VASRVFAAVSGMDVRVICQGVSDRTISFLVEEEKVEESVQRLHVSLFGKPDASPDWGGVSAAFCQAGFVQGR